jgi:hypothetical protein
MIVSSHSTDDNINILRPSAFTPTNFNSTISNNGEPFNSSSKAYSGIDFSGYIIIILKISSFSLMSLFFSAYLKIILNTLS